MEQFLIYIGKASIAAGAFYLTFLMLFQSRKQFAFNRIYLPVSFLLSFLIPLITFTTIRYIETSPVNDAESFAFATIQTSSLTQKAFVWEWYHYLFGIFCTGLAGFLFNLLLGHLKAILIIRKSNVVQLFKSEVHLTKKDVHPFSFFNKIVIFEKTIDSPNLEMIIEHEKVHVKEKHTFDILISEILFLFQWFNPFAWLLKDAVKNNLEYKTDHEITKRFNPQTYQLAMVALADKKGVAPFLTALNGGQLKSRIIMMKKKTENKYAVLKQIVILPLLAVLVMGLSNKEVKTEFVQSKSNETNEVIKTIRNRIDPEFFGKIYKDGLLILEDYGEQAPRIILNDKVVIEKVIIAETDLKWGEVIQPEQAIEKYGEKGKNGVLVFNTKDEYVGFKPGQVNQNISGKITHENDTLKPPRVVKIQKVGNESLSNALYLVNGVEVENLEDIDPNDIEKVNILKGDSAFVKYGDKGKNGVVLVTTKDLQKEKIVIGYPSPTNLGTTITHKNADYDKAGFDFGSFKNVQTFDDPIVIVDGRRYDSIDDAKVDPADIASISVLKNETAESYVKIYGQQAMNGVIIINTKTKYNTVEDKPKPLIVIDGVISETKKIDDINPETIESINVLKDASATEKYGVKGKDGVIEITLKPENITTDLKLRRFIAERIKFPVEAQEKGIVGNISMAVTFDKNGKIIKTDKSNPKFDNLDEVVVTAGNPENIKPVQDDDSEDLRQEMIRIINLMPAVDIDELKGKTVNIPVKFQLQFDSGNQNNTRNNGYDFMIPEGFSPNGDGIHDVFEIRGLEKQFPDFQMKIYNSNRDLIWQYKHNGDPNKTPAWWDGKDKDKKVKTGNYYYEIKYNDGTSNSTSGIFILAK